MKNQLTTGGGGVDGLGDKLQAHLLVTQVFDGLNKLLKRPGQPVQLPYHERVTCPHEIQRRSYRSEN